MATIRRILLGAAGAALAAGMALPGALPAHAAGASGCSGSWSSTAPTQQASCSFTAAYNTPESSYVVDVWGSSFRSSLTGSVAGVVRVVDPSGNVLAQCVVTLNGFCTASAASTDMPVPPGTLLTCTVQGYGGGTYGCDTR